MSLVLEGLSLSLSGRSLVKNLSLIVSPGEVVGLLGPNGAGKTTTFNLIIGFTRADFGRISLDQRLIGSLPMTKRSRLGIGYLPQEASVFRNLTVRDNLDIALDQSKLSAPVRRVRKEELINEFNLRALLDRLGSQLSGGERRRCEVARALAVGRQGPKYLLLDEPFAGVDPIAVIDLQSLIYKLKKKGVGILITDHNVRETLAITDRSYILSDGEILSSGTSDQVANDSIVRKSYLGEGFKL